MKIYVTGLREQWVHEEVEYFNSHLEDYYQRFYDDPHWAAYRATVGSAISRYNMKSVLDLGCGPAPSIPIVYENAEEYVAVDPAQCNILHMRQYFPRAQVFQSTAEELNQLNAGPFDMILSFGVLHHLREPSIALKACIEKLKPTGVLVAHEPSSYWNGKMGSPNEHGFTREELVGLFRPQFRILQFRTYHYPRLHHVLYSVLVLAKLWPILRSVEFWRFVHALEEGMDRSGFHGKDFLIVAERV